NTYTLFAELVRHIQSDTGRVGVIVPSGIATDDTTKYYFQDIMDSAALVSLYDFENRAGLFPAVDSRMKFCLLTLTGADRPAQAGAQFVFFALDVAHLREEARRFTLSAADIALLNPNTRTCPIFRGKRDAELTKAIYRSAIPIGNEQCGFGFQPKIDMTDEVGKFYPAYNLSNVGHVQTRVVLNGVSYLRLYESKLTWHYDHRFATFANCSEDEFNSGSPRRLNKDEQMRPDYFCLPRYYVPELLVNKRYNSESSTQNNYLLAVRRLTNSTNERTAVFSLLPKSGCGNSMFVFTAPTASRYIWLLSCGNTFAFDYCTRNKVGGTNFLQFIIEQLPLVAQEKIHNFQGFLAGSRWLRERILELVYVTYDLLPFAQDCGYYGPPFRWDEERRFLLRCELDAAYFHLYGIGREDVAYIMDTFPIVRRKDEAAHGEYRTKRVILEIYDEMGAAISAHVAADSHPRSSGQEAQEEARLGNRGYELKPPPAHPDAAPAAADSHPRSPAEEARLGNRGYETRLNPPPAHPDAAHQWDAAYLGPELPRDEWWQPAAADSHPRASSAAPEAADSHPRAPAEEARLGNRGYELKPPPMPKAKPAAKPALDVQPALVTDFTPPQGGYSLRLKRVMALGQPKNQMELTELIAALGDENGQIRWLAGASLVKVGGTAVVRLLAAYLGTGPDEVAQSEARKVLGMIAETDEDEAVQQAARAAAQ
ncbi:MAG: HEAT repeat domain-containing protein, partial [Chloroflexi bacterium]|nr:HEAT repeat domain-containing protein [Chloroflexota bacterium]